MLRRPLAFVQRVLLAGVCSAAPAASAQESFITRANDLTFSGNSKPPFLGLFTHVEPRLDFAGKLATLRQIIADNPHIVGFTLKIHWRQLHPEPQRWDWAGLEALIATAHAAGKLVNLGIIPGAASPEWIYQAGVKKAGPFEFGRIQAHTPLPWDRKFMELYLADIRELARRYADDPRVFQVQILGHNYNEAGEEMHAPAIEAMKPHGWTRELVLENWRFWIDRYAEAFPRKKLSLIVSQMYRGGEQDLPNKVADYFVERCAPRAVLQTHQIHGRDITLPPSAQTCARLARHSASSHEAVGSFLEQPARQGSAAMTVYNCRMAGDNLLYFQLWRRDSNDPRFAREWLEAWSKYGALPLAELKSALVRDGVFVEKSSYVPPAVPPTAGPHKSAAKGIDR